QFSNVSAFILSIEHLGAIAGLAKVIPPREWTESLVHVKDKLPSITISKPIEQNFMGGGLPPGAFRQMNLEARKTYTVQEWFELCQSSKYQTPMYNAGTGKVFQESVAIPIVRKRKKNNRDNAEDCLVSSTNADGPAEDPKLEAVDSDMPALPSEACLKFVSPQCSVVDGISSDVSTAANEGELPISPLSRIVLDCRNPEISKEVPINVVDDIEKRGSIVTATDIAADVTEFKIVCDEKRRKPAKGSKREIEFDFNEISKGFTPEYVKELEKFYWKNISYVSPFYGADMLGSLFDKSVANPWNLSTFDNILNNLTVKLPGVNNPYLYFGMWKATFAWHLEDMDLFSINYIHFGAPKQCPSALLAQGIKVEKLVQYEGEFVITFPFGYHAGYNLGFNCAESVNFAVPSWINIGKQASFCKCIPDAVKLDVGHLFEGKPPRDMGLVLRPFKKPSATPKNQHCDLRVVGETQIVIGI
ncbi:Lysine-specific demethylase 4B, partial [Entophlyctis luteolus]